MRGAMGVRKGQEGPGVPMVDAEPPVEAWVGPWQYQWVPGGWGRGSTHPVYPPSRTQPVQPSCSAHPSCSARYEEGATETGSLARPKEILGSITHIPGWISLGPARTPLTQAPQSPSWSLPVGPAGMLDRARMTVLDLINRAGPH